MNNQKYYHLKFKPTYIAPKLLILFLCQKNYCYYFYKMKCSFYYGLYVCKGGIRINNWEMLFEY